MRLRILDLLLIIVALGAVAGVSVYAYGDNSEASQVSVRTNEGEFLYPIDKERELHLEGPIGTTHVIIDGENGRVRVESSPCRDQICVVAGWLDATGEWTACLPNRVFVRVEGGERSDGIDGQTY